MNPSFSVKTDVQVAEVYHDCIKFGVFNSEFEIMIIITTFNVFRKDSVP